MTFIAIYLLELFNLFCLSCVHYLTSITNLRVSQLWDKYNISCLFYGLILQFCKPLRSLLYCKD